ncbi:MAG: peptidase M23 [Chitinophagales bacterium]|nr:MAG: peptidase M23 [Chitinophagales bacterium]
MIDKLRNKYRLVILDDDTFEERASFRLNRFNVYMLLSVVSLLMAVGIFALIAFTPLKEYIPGYGSMDVRREVINLELRSDSLEQVVLRQEAWINNVRNILYGNVDTAPQSVVPTSVIYDTIDLERVPEEDLLLREEIENEQRYELVFSGQPNTGRTNIAQLNFFPPLKGYLTAGFNPREEHFGVDIVAPAGEPIKSILDGHVVFADWTVDAGYVIAVQHANDLISFYKHNSVLLKKVGNFVKAGDAIAIIGNSGEMTSGPHLHFELWHEGLPLNPEEYIVF